MSTDNTSRLAKIRSLLKEHQLDYYFVPSRDVHNNEYVPACWQRRTFISGFTGSAGDALIGLTDAYLWTDARYFIQAEEQLDANHFTLMKLQQGASSAILDWVLAHAVAKRVGVDPQVMSVTEQQSWETAINATGGELVSIDYNLVDAIWENRPQRQHTEAHQHHLKYAGQSVEEKLSSLREKLALVGADAHTVNMLDSIAWLFNIRGQDVDYNPLTISFALITSDQAILFADLHQISPDLKEHLQSQGVSTHPYEDFASTLQAFSGRILIDPNTANWWMTQHLSQATIIQASSPISLMKAIKNEAEQAGARLAHIEDGVSLCKTFHWLEQNWQTASELSVSDKVKAIRIDNSRCKGLSFPTISSYAKHGAINHYSVSAESSLSLGDDSLFLLDSGAQYFEGTTDVTRTIHFGTPTKEQQKHYTLVLKGHLALRHAVFVDGTCGEHLNALAHMPLWSHGLDFGHGTGHGVGSYLCVHEGPQRISQGYSHTPLVPGMILSNEPGVYFANQYGIRIENLLLVVPKIPQTDSLTGHGPFYGFEDLTLFPYARNLIDTTLLNETECQQINDYHADIFSKLHEKLSTPLSDWLKIATAPL